MDTQVVYIAGPITTGGKSIEENLAAFHVVANKLKARGFAVLNPAALPEGMEEYKYMDICVAMVRSCDVIVMLDGWGRSDGAHAEYTLAKKLNKLIVNERDLSFSREEGAKVWP